MLKNNYALKKYRQTMHTGETQGQTLEQGSQENPLTDNLKTKSMSEPSLFRAYSEDFLPQKKDFFDLYNNSLEASDIKKVAQALSVMPEQERAQIWQKLSDKEKIQLKKHMDLVGQVVPDQVYEGKIFLDKLQRSENKPKWLKSCSINPISPDALKKKEEKVLGFLPTMDVLNVAHCLKGESIIIIAVLFEYFSDQQKAQYFQLLDTSMKKQLVLRLSHIKSVHQIALKALETVLIEKGKQQRGVPEASALPWGKQHLLAIIQQTPKKFWVSIRKSMGKQNWEWVSQQILNDSAFLESCPPQIWERCLSCLTCLEQLQWMSLWPSSIEQLSQAILGEDIKKKQEHYRIQGFSLPSERQKKMWIQQFWDEFFLWYESASI